MAVDRNEPTGNERPAYRSMAEHHPAAVAAQQEQAQPVQVAQATVTSQDIVNALTPKAGQVVNGASTQHPNMPVEQMTKVDPSELSVEQLRALSAAQAAARKRNPGPGH